MNPVIHGPFLAWARSPDGGSRASTQAGSRPFSGVPPSLSASAHLPRFQGILLLGRSAAEGRFQGGAPLYSRLGLICPGSQHSSRLLPSYFVSAVRRTVFSLSKPPGSWVCRQGAALVRWHFLSFRLESMAGRHRFLNQRPRPSSSSATPGCGIP